VTARQVVVAAGLVAALLAGCSGGGEQAGSEQAGGEQATSGTASDALVISHRGASGYRPEHTAAAYELAVTMGADYLEPDLVMTRDKVLVDRHEPEISQTTDVASRPELASLRRTRTIDGKATTGWFVEDLTLAQLRTLRAKERIPDVRPGNTAYDGRYPVLTFDEVLDLRDRLARESGRTIGVIPELKHPTYLRSLGFEPERALLEALGRHRLTAADAPVWVQSFEPTSLQRLREAGYRGRSVLLVQAGGAPYDLASTGDRRDYADLVSTAGLADVKKYANGVAPEKDLVIPRTGTGALGRPTDLVTRAHAAGLEVMVWTFRAENTFLPAPERVGTDPDAKGDLAGEVEAYLRAGVDAVFCDQPDLCVEARSAVARGG
jgi:glycerophosphoryl diester phosphodiesterase